MPNSLARSAVSPLSNLIFLSRWLQAPLYVGLIIAQVVYVYRFLVELWHLIGFAVLGYENKVDVAGCEAVVGLGRGGRADVVPGAGGVEIRVERLRVGGIDGEGKLSGGKACQRARISMP